MAILQDGAQRPAPSRSQAAVVGLAVAAVAVLVYWLGNHNFNAGHPDFYYLADAFLHGRTWIDRDLGPYDVIYFAGRVYVPFGLFPAVILTPLVALLGPTGAAELEPVVNAVLAGAGVGLAWWVAGRIGVDRLNDRLMLVVLLGFSTQIWWVTTRGGVWHTGQLVATILTLFLLAELYGRGRPVLMGLLIGAAFLCRAPDAFALPATAIWVAMVSQRQASRMHGVWAAVRGLPWLGWVQLALGFLPALVLFVSYNVARFGSPLESGYGLAVLPDWLEALRRQGMFSPRHVAMNLEYFLFKLPTFSASFPFFRPDGLGMSVLFTSPGLLLALRAPWRDPRSRILAVAGLLVLVPTLFYYGGGWLQYGYRYFLDSMPFVWALVAMGVVFRGSFKWWHRLMIWAGVVVMTAGVYWAYNL